MYKECPRDGPGRDVGGTESNALYGVVHTWGTDLGDLKKSSVGLTSGGHWLDGHGCKESTLGKATSSHGFRARPCLGQHCPIPAGLSKSHTLGSNGRQLWWRGK